MDIILFDTGGGEYKSAKIYFLAVFLLGKNVFIRKKPEETLI